MLYSIYHMTLRLLWNLFFGVKKLQFCHHVRSIAMDVMFPKICKPLVVYRFYSMAVIHSQTQRHMMSMLK